MPSGRREWHPGFPAVTLAVAGLQLLVFNEALGKQPCCSSASAVLEDGQWVRVLSAVFHHESRRHLVVDLLSFLWKGYILELSLGSQQLLCVLAKLSALVGVTHILLALVLAEITGSVELYNACASTFPGVLVALKVVNQHNFNFRKLRRGEVEVELPSPVLCWVELVALHAAYGGSVLPLIAGLLVGIVVRGNIISCKNRTQLLLKNPFLPITYLLVGMVLTVHLFYVYMEPCVSFRTVFRQWQFWQLLLPAVYTQSSYQLAYTTLSLISLGYQVEKKWGHLTFLLRVVSCVLWVNVAHCLLSWLLSYYPSNLLPPSPEDTCYCGLTGALLALKILHYWSNPEADYDFASFQFAVPPSLGVAVEVTHLYLFSPKAWIIGHLAGILVGALLACSSETVSTPIAN